MDFSIQSQLLGSILNCLCELFTNENTYPGAQQTEIEQIKTQIQNVFNQAKQTLQNSTYPFTSSLVFSTEDYCGSSNNTWKLLNTIWDRASDHPDEDIYNSSDTDQLNSLYNQLMSLFDQVLDELKNESITVCAGGWANHL